MQQNVELLGAFDHPSLKGKYISDFIGKNVMYLIRIGGTTYLKYGITDDLARRLKEHQHDFKGFVLRLYWVCEVVDARALERAVIDHLKYRGLNARQVFNGKMQTELADISRCDAEDVRQMLVELQSKQGAVDAPAALDRFRIEQETVRHRHMVEAEAEVEVERERITQSARSAFLELLVKSGHHDLAADVFLNNSKRRRLE